MSTVSLERVRRFLFWAVERRIKGGDTNWRFAVRSVARSRDKEGGAGARRGAVSQRSSREPIFGSCSIAGRRRSKRSRTRTTRSSTCATGNPRLPLHDPGVRAPRSGWVASRSSPPMRSVATRLATMATVFGTNR